MDLSPSELTKEADSELFKGNLSHAMELYIQAVFSQLYNTDEDSDPKESMEKAVHCYQKINPDYSLNPTQDYIQQYFTAVRQWFDLRYTDDLEKIEEEIYRSIPLEAADDQREELPHGELHSHSLTVEPYTVGIACGQGIRDEMEDAHAAFSFNIGNHQLHQFCVFDGHGGKTCAQYIARELPDVLREELNSQDTLDVKSIYHAFVTACVRVDREWKTLPFQQEDLLDISGSTATVAVIVDQKDLWVANVGDSGAAIDEDGKAIQLTESAKPIIPKYYKEVFMRGGVVSYGRVDATLDMARSIGDLAHPSISARPTIKKVEIDTNNHYLIVACDGLWDVIDAQTALDSIKNKKAQEAAEHLRMLAYQRGSTDNVTILVVSLQ